MEPTAWSTHAVFTVAVVVAVFGTAHLLALSSPDSRLGRAYIALGF
jgi:hypothetical protein